MPISWRCGRFYPSPSACSARPVAGADYWRGSGLKSWIAGEVFRAVLIDRDPAKRQTDPVETVAQVLRGGEDVICTPGARNLTDAPLAVEIGDLSSGPCRTRAEIVPAWILDLDRILPKGAVVPVPLNCAVRFGQPMRPAEGEDRDSFLARLGAACLALSDRS